jgi:lysozyme
MIHGLDVSDNNGTFNWNKSIAFGIAKATQGVTDEDTQFSRNWAQMEELGLLRGAYHYMTAGLSGEAQAEYFVNFVRMHGLGLNDALMLDMETNCTNLNIQQFVNTVKSMTGKNVFVYSEYSIIHEGKFDGLYDQPLWIANPEGEIGNPPEVSPFKIWSMQQYSWTPYDQNVFNGTAQTWRELVNLTTPPVREFVTANGHESLEQLATGVKTTPVAMLQETFITAHTFGSALTPYLNNILEGKASSTTPVPNGTRLYYLKG